MGDLDPTRVLNNPNGISIGAAVFAGLTNVTDRPTDHATRSVTIGCIYVRTTAMWPNNYSTTHTHTHSNSLTSLSGVNKPFLNGRQNLALHQIYVWTVYQPECVWIVMCQQLYQTSGQSNLT